jgi:hypothetical protein
LEAAVSIDRQSQAINSLVLAENSSMKFSHSTSCNIDASANPQTGDSQPTIVIWTHCLWLSTYQAKCLAHPYPNFWTIEYDYNVPFRTLVLGGLSAEYLRIFFLSSVFGYNYQPPTLNATEDAEHSCTGAGLEPAFRHHSSCIWLYYLDLGR